MANNNKLKKICKYNTDYNNILGLSLGELDIYQSCGLWSHLDKRNHDDAKRYIKNTSDIINNPDYIGIKNNADITLQFIKRYKVPVSVIVKTDKQSRLYVSTVYVVNDNFINKQINKGNLFSTSRKGTLHSQTGT